MDVLNIDSLGLWAFVTINKKYKIYKQVKHTGRHGLRLDLLDVLVVIVGNQVHFTRVINTFYWFLVCVLIHVLIYGSVVANKHTNGSQGHAPPPVCEFRSQRKMCSLL